MLVKGNKRGYSSVGSDIQSFSVTFLCDDDDIKHQKRAH